MPSPTLSFQRYLQQHMPLYIFVTVLFMMGVIFGALLVNALTLDQQQNMAQLLEHFFQTAMQGFEGTSPQSFADLFSLHFRWVLLILVFGLSIVGLPLILIIDFIKGALIGFAVGYLVAQYSWKGLLFALISVAPHNLIVIPVLLISSVAAISFSLYLIRCFILRNRTAEAQPFLRYLLTHLTLSGLLVCAAVIQYVFIPRLLEWAAPLMLQTS